MTVYVRTEEGQLAAYSASSALPRKLRSLLKVIDGKTALDVYVQSLQSFGDVRGVLKSLDLAGLIRPMSQLPIGAAKLELQTANDSASTVWGNTSAQSRQKAGNQKFQPASNSEPDTQANYMQTRMGGGNYGLADDLERTRALAQAVDAMSNFVLTHTPEHSFMVLKELEQISNLEQLAVTLGGYEQLIAHTGSVAQTHLNMVKSLLRAHL